MSPLSRLSVAVLAVLCAHCDSPRIVAAPSVIVVSPQAFQLGELLVGDTATMTVEVFNHGAPVQLSLRADEPVTLDTAALALRRGERKTVLAALTATTAGPISTMVHVFTAGVVAGQVRIEAVAVQRSGCVANACETASVASDGTCRRDVTPDGVACASACLAEATCASAICVGTPRRCDDGDACTVDSCGADGCRHTARSCHSERACHTAICDPSEGCKEVPVADGTACGESDCTTSTVCMNGACTTVPTPQGRSCQPSPCATGGQCDASGACIGGASAYLKADWTYAPQGDVGAFGAASRAGTVYFVESTPRFDGFQASRTVELVALKSTGSVAWRQTLIAADAGVDVWISPMARGHLAVAGDVVVSMLEGGKALYAFDELSGAPLWTRSVPLLMDEAFNYPAHPDARVVDAAEVSGALVLSVSAPQSGPQQCEGMWSGGLVAVAQRTGSVLWAHSQQEGCWNGASVVADTAGRTFMTVKRPLEPETTWAFDAAGALLWKMPGRALMAGHGRVIAGAIRDGQSGAALSPLPSPSGRDGPAVALVLRPRV